VGRPRRLLTIGHSYVVAANRRLAHEMAVASGGAWDVTAVAPSRYRADLGRIVVQPLDGEASHLEPLPVHGDRVPHLMWYGGLGGVFDRGWDVVHCWEEPYVASAAQIANATALRVPLVFATFQNIVKRYPPPFNWIERSAMQRADAIIAFGHTARDVLEARGWQQPARTIPPGVDVALFRTDNDRRDRTRARLGWSGDVPVVGFLGRLVPEKGIGLLTRVLDRVTTPWRALFVGSGPLEAEVRTWARQYGDRIRVETGVGHDDVPAYLNAMDLLVAPSQTKPRWREQFGRMLIEAFAGGVPVVASDSGEIPYVVADAGVIVPENDEAQWLAAVDALLRDPARRADLARRGRARAESMYAWPVVARQHLAFFGDLLG
jgi:phosphatidyl-myo-inositol dimannoside synthase